MKKVFQTIVDKGNGNCQQATIATLFGKELADIPHFLENMDNPAKKDFERHSIIWMWENGYPNASYITTNTIDDLRKVTKYDGGINGYFIATVLSQTYKDGTTHSVIVDMDLKVVHDPNPNQLAMNLKQEDVMAIYTMNKDFYVVDNEIVDDSKQQVTTD